MIALFIFILLPLAWIDEDYRRKREAKRFVEAQDIIWRNRTRY